MTAEIARLQLILEQNCSSRSKLKISSCWHTLATYSICRLAPILLDLLPIMWMMLAQLESPQACELEYSPCPSSIAYHLPPKQMEGANV